MNKQTELKLYSPSGKQVKLSTLEEHSFAGAFDERIEFFKHFLHPLDLVFDVGAHLGLQTKVFLECGAQVVCFEPYSGILPRLIRNVGLHPSVQIEPIGLARKMCILTQLICLKNPELSTFSKSYSEGNILKTYGVSWDRTYPAFLTTLDRMIERYGLPSFCKIDVAGFEEEVLCGLSKRIPLLAFEASGELHELTVRCVERLMQLGYEQFNFCPGERGLFLSLEWMRGQELLQLLETLAETHDWTKTWTLGPVAKPQGSRKSMILNLFESQDKATTTGGDDSVAERTDQESDAPKSITTGFLVGDVYAR